MSAFFWCFPLIDEKSLQTQSPLGLLQYFPAVGTEMTPTCQSLLSSWGYPCGGIWVHIFWGSVSVPLRGGSEVWESLCVFWEGVCVCGGCFLLLLGGGSSGGLEWNVDPLCLCRDWLIGGQKDRLNSQDIRGERNSEGCTAGGKLKFGKGKLFQSWPTARPTVCPNPRLTRVRDCQRSRTMSKPMRTSGKNTKVTAPRHSSKSWSVFITTQTVWMGGVKSVHALASEKIAETHCLWLTPHWFTLCDVRCRNRKCFIVSEQEHWLSQDEKVRSMTPIVLLMKWSALYTLFLLFESSCYEAGKHLLEQSKLLFLQFLMKRLSLSWRDSVHGHSGLGHLHQSWMAHVQGCMVD